MEDTNKYGLSTREAINKLHNDIEQLLNQFKLSQKTRKSKSWVEEALHHYNQRTTINWISSLFILTAALVLITSYIITKDNIFNIYNGILIVILLFLSITLELFDNKFKHNEVTNRITILLQKFQKQMNKVVWSSKHYPNLYAPFSPCITLQWTYRDNKIVNLPWALLVKDDIIVIRPGQVSPGYCESIEKNSEYPLLHAKEVYGPSLQNANEIFSTPKARKPLENKKYRLLETPYLNNLRTVLEQSLDKPVSQQNQQRYFVMVKILERLIFPICFIVIFIINFVRYSYLKNVIGESCVVNSFLVMPISILLPLLPIVFPIVWNLLNYLAIARFKLLYESTINVIKNKEAIDLSDDQDTLQENTINNIYQWKGLWKSFVNILIGRDYMLCRSVNIVHVLGSVTALCCIDKKGILSWPNPTAEKVFILHNTDNASQSSSLADLGELHTDGDSGKYGNHENSPHSYHLEGSNSAIAEVLDLTHDNTDPIKLHFDDTKWYKHLNSLKPLGLAILLNTCNVNTQEHYMEFCSHITCEAMYNESLVPVTNRRCLCELAKEIGFSDQAQKIFALEQKLSTFRHIQPEMVRRDNKYARSLSMSTKLKFPFPHMFAVVVKELSGGSIQLLSQGTADIILDSCVDYWDGHDLCPLTNSDRKKIQDFYQRTSLTAYCSAFAYRPMSKAINDKLSQVYLELPSESRHLYHSHRSPTPVHWDCRSVLEPKIRAPLGPFFSTDSLLYNDSPCSDITDADSCFETQCNQIFIGMVTMQYQAQADMVQLIEQLERACIRFVHFSKENELRSRVFSEKMGLESGWNCHISLLSERNRRDSGPLECWANNATAHVVSPSKMPRRLSRSTQKLQTTGSSPHNTGLIVSNLQSSRTMSFSAPSAINMEHSVVKFDMEHESIIRIINDRDDDEQNGTSQDSVQLQTVDLNYPNHDWQSLSCLTDSTEHSAPINFDMSNRAKLPRGIDKIRPHIECIDNVPLLVSLFTDCTASVTREMLNIMQDYDEVVCVMGSSANSDNVGIFMQADASIAIEPLYPQICQKQAPFDTIDPEESFSSPIEMSRLLNSIACSLSLKRENPICIFDYIAEARNFTQSLWNLVQFWLCCCITLTILQMLCALFLLPNLLAPGQVLWIICIIVPVLSVSLMGVTTNSDVMKKPRGKNVFMFNSEVAVFVFWCYGMKFLPVVITVLITFTGILSSYCTEICSLSNCTCVLLHLPMDQNSTIKSWHVEENSYILFSAQHFIVIIILMHFIVISLGFVHREHVIWLKSPHTNTLWLWVIALLFFLQCIYTFVNLHHGPTNFENDVGFKIANCILIFALLSPIITFIANEFIKYKEIKVNLRYQKRARLDFGTKLGMNSPF